MLCYWFSYRAPKHVSVIELLFPMVGHSFLPADRVFARIEKDVKLEIIESPIGYLKISQEEHGIAIHLAGKVFDWKATAQDVFKLPGNWHFQFNPSKRFFLGRSTTGHIMVKRSRCLRRTKTCLILKQETCDLTAL